MPRDSVVQQHLEPLPGRLFTTHYFPRGGSCTRQIITIMTAVMTLVSGNSKQNIQLGNPASRSDRQELSPEGRRWIHWVHSGGPQHRLPFR